jgi:hypothetical protein
MICPNCNNLSLGIKSRVTVTSQHINASLVHCPECDFLFIDQPTWLESAYQLGFYADTGYVSRNLMAANFLKSLFSFAHLCGFASASLEGCDVGTGLGMLPRMMRDAGYRFHGQDQFSGMELIQPFVTASIETPVVTAFEVVEHVVSLPCFLKEHLSRQPELFIFSTVFRKDSCIPPHSWWYYAFEVGQHISFHSKESFRKALTMAELKPRQIVSFDCGIHAVAFSQDWARLISFYALLRRVKIHYLTDDLLCRLFRRRSLTEQDHRDAIAQIERAPNSG